MKKIIAVILSVITATSLAACQKEQVEPKEMTIKPTEFSEETTAVLNVIGRGVGFFDYYVDETIKSQSIEIWVFENEEWVSSGKMYGDINEFERQVAIKMDDKYQEIFNHTAEGISTLRYNIDMDFSESLGMIDFMLGAPMDITPNEEITLYYKLGYDKTEIETTDDFRNSGCKRGIAVTVTFSDKIID